MWPIFLVDSILFWILVSFFIIFEFIWTAKGRGAEGFFTFVIFLVVLSLFTNLKIGFLFDPDNFQYIGITFLSYIIIGVVWSMIQWTRACRQRAKYYNELKAEWNKDDQLKKQFIRTYERMNSTELAAAETTAYWKYIFDRWQSRYGRIYSYHETELDSIKQLIPQASKSKNRITSWMMMWPFDLIWRIISDLIINLWQTIFNWCKNIFQNISNRQFKDLT